MQAIKFFCLVFLFFSNNLFAANSQSKLSQNQASNLTVSATYDQNLENILIFADFQIKSGWFIYAPNNNGFGLAPEFDFSKSENINQTKDLIIYWPQSIEKTEDILDSIITYNIYKSQAVIPVQITPINNQEATKINLQITYGLCNNICIPVTENFTLNIPAKFQDLNLLNNDNQLTTAQNPQKLISNLTLQILIIAILGGLILNIMPCVLPVLSIKLLSIIKHSQSTISNIRLALFSTFLGIIFSFIILAAMVMLLKYFGQIVGWGIQFQNPYFLIFLITVTLVFASNLFGIFNFNFNFNFTNKIDQRINHFQFHIFIPNFLSGILAVLLATPCSAPFLGTAISFALAANYLEILLIFIFIAIGMGLPYIILIIMPNWVKILPKSGNWMIIFRKIMAIFLILTAIWLSCVLLINLRSDTQINDEIWQNFKQEKITQYLSENKTVIIDITASWCLTCKLNKARVLNSPEVINQLKNPNIIAMVGDISKPNDKIMRYLESKNRYAIPFNEIYCQKYPDGYLFSELLNKEEFLEKINQCN